MRYRDGDAALRGAVQLRDDEAVQVERGVELLRLVQSVLAGRCVDHEHDPHGDARALARHAHDLLKLSHELRARVEPARRVDQHQLGVVLLRAVQHVVAHARGIDPALARDDLDAGALPPDLELLDRGRAERVAAAEDDARAKGYMKGKLKKEEVFSLLKRATSPQTIYKKQKLDRDDILDITDFDVVAWIKSEMNIMLDEEKARAILIGDGRLNSSDDKISEDHIRPIVNDKPLFTIKADVEAGATDELTAKNVIKACLKSRKDYKGSGTPTLFTTEEWLTNMLLIEDDIGHRLYKTETEVATACRVKEIVTVPVMEGFKDADNKLVYGIIVNMADYTIGADKGGQTALFEDFDIDYNQEKYLIETRMSGALTKPFSAIVLRAATASANVGV